MKVSIGEWRKLSMYERFNMIKHRVEIQNHTKLDMYGHPIASANLR